MTTEMGQGFLASIRSDWLERGWDLNTLRSFRMEGEEGTATETNEGTETSQGTESQDSGYSEFAAGFLKDVPDSQKVLIEPYIKKWDSGVTKKFQEIHSQYEPYKELGDPETLAQAVQIMNMLDNEDDAKQIYDILHQQYGQKVADEITGGDPQNKEGQGEASGLPPEWAQKFDQQQTLLTTLAEIVLGSHQQEQQAQEDTELENYLGELKEKHGDFDEEYVLAKMAAGIDGEDAVKSFHNIIQSRINTSEPQRTLSPTLSGGGSVPAETQSVKDLSRSETKNLVASILAQQAQES